MLKNIILDVGGIILDDSKEYIDKILNCDSTKIYQKVYQGNFKNCLLGTYTFNEHISSFVSDPDYEKIKYILDINNKDFYPLLKDNFEYIKTLKKRGYNLYLLSNISKESYEHLDKLINISKYFQGGVYSCFENLVKPDIKIYDLIIQKYNLNKDETIFFDDKEKNVKTANKYGIKSYVFKNINDIEKVLNN